MVSATMAARLSDEIGGSADDIGRALSHLDDTEAARFLGRGGRQFEPSGVRQAAALRGTEILADQPSRAAGQFASEGSSAAKFAAGAGTLGVGAGAGALAFGEQKKTERLEKRKENVAENRELASEIANNPNLPDEDKEDLIRSIIGEDGLQLGGAGDEAKGIVEKVSDGLLGGFDFFDPKNIILIIIAYYVGKAALRRLEKRDSGGD
jgi:hypothetical protein